jgi:hypothetical protein
MPDYQLPLPLEPTRCAQCLNCGRVEAPAVDPYRCSSCGGLELHVFPQTETTGSALSEGAKEQSS